MLENTLILFTSDHGEMLVDHHLFGKCEPFEGSADADLESWRQRLAVQFADRPEGFSRDGRLIIGRPHRIFVPGKGPEVEWGDVGR